MPFIMRRMRMSGPDDCLQIIRVGSSTFTHCSLSLFAIVTLRLFETFHVTT
jgi:hypothetical protein